MVERNDFVRPFRGIERIGAKCIAQVCNASRIKEGTRIPVDSPGERVAENGPDRTAAANHRPVESAHYAVSKKKRGYNRREATG